MDLGMKEKILEELMKHIDQSQGMDLEALLNKSKEPAPPEEGMEELDEMGKPKALEVPEDPLAEKEGNGMGDKMDAVAEDMSEAKPDEDDMSEEELKELLAKYL